jgi:hypothetical protein
VLTALRDQRHPRLKNRHGRDGAIGGVGWFADS